MDKTEGFFINFKRREVLPSQVRRVAAYVALGFLAIQGVIAFGLLSGSFLAFAQGQYLASQLRRKMPASSGAFTQEMKVQQQHATENLASLNAAITLEQGQFPVAGKLAALAKTLPDRTWVTGLSENRAKRSITVKARTLVDPAKPNLLPANAWMQALKADPQFAQGLRRIALSPSSRGKQGDVEVADFEFTAEWES